MKEIKLVARGDGRARLNDMPLMREAPNHRARARAIAFYRKAASMKPKERTRLEMYLRTVAQAEARLTAQGVKELKKVERLMAFQRAMRLLGR